MKFDRRLLRQIAGVRIFLLLTVVLSALTGALIVVQASYLTDIIQQVFLAHQTVQGVGNALLVLVGVILARALLVWGSGTTASFIAGRIKIRLRERLVRHLFTLGPAYTRSERSGEITNTLNEGVEALDAYFSQYIPQVFLAVLVPVIIAVAVFSVDRLSGIILLVSAPLLPLLMALVGVMASAETRKQWKLLSLMSAHFLDVLQGLTTLKLFGREKAQAEIVQRVSEQYSSTTLVMLRVAFLSSLVLEMGATVSTAVVAIEAGLRLLYGQMPFDRAFFVLLLAPEFYLPLRMLGTHYHAGLTGSVAAERMFDILEVPVPVQDIQHTRLDRPLMTLDTLSFEDVYYAYDGQRPALQGVTFQLVQGQRVALVGPSGAGKSTIAQLLLRFIDADAGTIRVNDVPLLDMQAAAWRTQVAWVPQRPYLFNATVAENIRLGQPDATMRAVVEAARQAEAHEFIHALPQGYDTVIGERGTRLSGGEAQRISLARAFLKNAPLLILDEATAHLDPEHETKIVAAISRLMQGRTVLLIAHRLSTVYTADRILVLDGGRVVEEGTHQSLLQHSEVYRQLVNAYGSGGSGRRQV